MPDTTAGAPQAAPPRPTDVWAAGAAYESYVGRWSRLVAREFLVWLAPGPGQRWLDVGTGTGMLARAILEAADPSEVVGVDPSAGFLDHARSQATDARLRFEQGDARELPFDDGAFDAVVSGLVLNFVPDPARGLAEMARVARPGGLVAAYVWDYAEGMALMRYCWDAAVALDPAAAALDEGPRFPICRPDGLRTLFEGGGLDAVEVQAIEVPTVFADFGDYWSPFLGGQGPGPAYVMSLDEPRRAALRDRIRRTIPVEADGSIRLVARAWAVRATR